MTVYVRKEQHNLFDINKYKYVKWKSKKKITFHTAIYINVTVKLKCFTRNMQGNDRMLFYIFVC